MGANVSRLRIAAGKTQGQVADHLAMRGLSWRRSTVAQVETARRQIGLAEALALADVLDVPLVELLRTQTPVRVDLGQWHPKFLVAALEGTTGDLLAIESYTSPSREKMYSQIHVVLGALNSADQRHADRWPGRYRERDLGAATPFEYATARRIESQVRLGVRAPDVVAAADTLWRHSLTEERDRRVKRRANAKASPRTLQAVRGLVMRELDKELEAAIEEAANRAAVEPAPKPKRGAQRPGKGNR
ncbi:MAG TPA: helix-turn-helix transcriptional regulator [Acidimicrobiales bacterium]|nr:helix-turn-helix transcriptional regulator [Acidimicrobiales bacterium]